LAVKKLIDGFEAIEENQMTMEEGFFDFAAEVGLTKHLGSLESTERLIDLCQIKAGDYVLDVGCGVGATPVFLARQIGCRVMGVDILSRMVDRAQELADKQEVSHLTAFRTADAQELPFPDNLFDVVITESVTAFPEDKQRAVKEYARVLKPGGFVGLNESTWLKTPIPEEIASWISRQVGSSATPLLQEEWTALLNRAGFRDLSVEIQEVDIKDEAAGIMRRYGFFSMMRVLGRTFRLYLKNPSYREFAKDLKKDGITPENLPEYFGYGIYAGRKIDEKD